MTDSILTRRAVRNFKADKISNAEIYQLIAAFNAAPCGMHQADEMEAAVITKKEILNEIENQCDHACYDAPLLFVIATKKGSHFGERNSSVAAENVMIEANSLGLGSVYIMGAALQIDKNKEIKNKIGIDPNFEIQVIVSVGYANKLAEKEDRRNRYHVVIK